MMETLRGGCCLTHEAAYLNMARTLILMVLLWERRQPVCVAQTHMSCTALLNLRLIVMIQAIPHTIHIAHFSWATPVYNVRLYTVVYKSNQVDRIYISITMGKVDRGAGFGLLG